MSGKRPKQPNDWSKVALTNKNSRVIYSLIKQFSLNPIGVSAYMFVEVDCLG